MQYNTIRSLCARIHLTLKYVCVCVCIRDHCSCILLELVFHCLFIYFVFIQVWYSNPVVRDWLKEHADASELDKLKWMYYVINKSPW